MLCYGRWHLTFNILVKGTIWGRVWVERAIFRWVEWTLAVTRESRKLRAALMESGSVAAWSGSPPALPAARGVSLQLCEEPWGSRTAVPQPRLLRTHPGIYLLANLGAGHTGKWRKLNEKWAGQWNWCIRHGETSVEQVSADTGKQRWASEAWRCLKAAVGGHTTDLCPSSQNNGTCEGGSLPLDRRSWRLHVTPWHIFLIFICLERSCPLGHVPSEDSRPATPFWEQLHSVVNKYGFAQKELFVFLM